MLVLIQKAPEKLGVMMRWAKPATLVIQSGQDVIESPSATLRALAAVPQQFMLLLLMSVVPIFGNQMISWVENLFVQAPKHAQALRAKGDKCPTTIQRLEPPSAKPAQPGPLGSS